MLKTYAICAALISLTSCATAPNALDASQVQQTVSTANSIGFSLSPHLLVTPEGKDPNFPKGRSVSASKANRAINGERLKLDQCVAQYGSLKAEAMLLVDEIHKIADPKVIANEK